MRDQITRDLKSSDGKPLGPSTMMQIQIKLQSARKISDISDSIHYFNSLRPYQCVHMGICSLDGVPVKDTLHSCPIDGKGVSQNDFSEELTWGICQEAEYLLRPFDLLTHEFHMIASRKFETIRKISADVGLKQIMVVPVKIKNTTTIVTTNFPSGDFAEHAAMFIPEVFQVVSTIFERFPKLLTWSKDGKLTPREAEILSLSAKGLTEAVIAAQCGISINTVRNHVENCKVKLNARNKLHAVMIAAETHEIDGVSEF